MQKIVIIGADSYIATGLEKCLQNCQVNKLYFYNWQENILLLQEADYVINFSIAPDFSTRDMISDEILDIQIAKAIQKTSAKYIFISSRRVYGQSHECIIHKETDLLCGIDFYARNKIIAERALMDILGDKLMILRVSNIIGNPVDRKEYKTFIGWICESFLKTGKLVVTQNADAIKDFITKDFLQESIAELIQKKVTGIYNLSAGFGTSVRDVLTGYVGKEYVDFQGQHVPPTDQFVLNNEKLIQATGQDLSPSKISLYLNYCQKKLYILKNNY